MSILTHARTYVHHHTQTVPPYNQTPPTRTRRIHACPPSASPPAQPRTRPRPTHRPPSTPPVHPIDPTHSSPRPCGTHEQTHLCTREHTDAHAHTRTHEYTRVRTRVVSVKAVATAGSVAEHGEEGLPRRGNTIHTLTHLLRLASVALIAPRQRGDQKSAGGGGCFPFQKFKNGGWSSIQTSRAANSTNIEPSFPCACTSWKDRQGAGPLSVTAIRLSQREATRVFGQYHDAVALGVLF